MPRKKSIYARIADALTQLIEDGAYGEGFPSEKTLGAIYQVSRKTIRRALAIVEKRGLLRVDAGKNRQVTPRKGKGGASVNTVACVVSRFATYYAEACNAIRSQLRQKGYAVEFTFQRHDKSVDPEFFRTAYAGAILLGLADNPTIAEVVGRVGGAAVLVNNEECLLPINAVGTNSFLNAYRAAEYLIANGHRRIGGIFAPHFPRSPIGFAKALEDRGLPFEKNVWTRDAVTDEELRAFIAENALTALYVSPLRAFGQTVLSALAASGTRVPDDLSFMGHDMVDIEVGREIVRPDCVSTDWEKIVEMSVNRLMELIAGDTTIVRSDVESRIVSRGTARNPLEMSTQGNERTRAHESVYA